MPFHFYSSHSALDNASLADACIFSEETEQRVEWRNLNPIAVNLLPDDTLSTSASFTTYADTGPISQKVQSEHQRARDRIHKISPSNPAIIFINSPAEALSSPVLAPANIFCSNITIISTSRTVELYSSGDYIGTFRGEPLILPTPPVNPLFTIFIDEQDLPQRSQELLVKFFIPAKPPVKPPLTPGAITLHWLAIQGKLSTTISHPQHKSGAVDTSSLESLGSTTKDIPSSDPIQSLLSNIQNQSSNLSPSPFSLPMLSALNSSGSSTINVETVRSMLSQMEVGKLSQGAMTLMRAMEAQAINHGEDIKKSESNIDSEMKQDISLQSTTTPPTVPSLEAKHPTNPRSEKPSSESPSLLTKSQESTFVTRKELEQMETMIMDTIEQRFKEMEERLLNKLLGFKKDDC